MYRILIADDEGIMLESLKNIISSNYGNECEIHTAKTGRVVVEEAEKYPPDICFMDIQMPGLSGKQKGDSGNMLQSYGKGRFHKTEAKR